MKILTGTQHHELDRFTIENEPISSIDLMERAAKAITKEIVTKWDKMHTVYIFSGSGNNGGDGLAVARMLVEDGYKVAAYLFNINNRLSHDCEINRDRLLELTENQTVAPRLFYREIKQGFDFPKVNQDDVIIDALFGTGLKQPLAGGFAVVARKINSVHAHVVSIDVPSGLMCEDNSFIDRNVVVHAELTLTIQLPKLAFLLPENEPCVGDWKALDINLSQEGINQLDTPYSIVEQQEVKDTLRPRSRFAHKGSMGHALLIAGSYGMAGAAILSSKACLHSGVGKLTLHTPASNTTIMQISVPEAVLSPDANKLVVSEAVDTSRYQAVGIGPGLGRDNATALAVQQYLMVADEPIVIDADALNILSEHRNWLSHIPSGSILTPHVKELEGFVGTCSNSYERLHRASDLAIQQKVYVILKGHYSAICTPNGRVLFCPRGNAGMATPGSGDVLTGILTGILAQGYTPFEACILGTWLHGSAGDFAAKELGEEYMLAGDIISHLPNAWKELRINNI